MTTLELYEELVRLRSLEASSNVEMLRVYASRLDQLAVEILLVADTVILNKIVRDKMVQAIRLLKAARTHIYDGVFKIVPGAVVTFNAELTPDGCDSAQVIATASPDGYIEYASGMTDLEWILTGNLISGKATISAPAPQISLGKNEG